SDEASIDTNDTSIADDQSVESTEATSAGDGASELEGIDGNNVDTESIQTEAESTETTSAGDDASELEGGDGNNVDTESIQTEAAATGETQVDEGFSEFDATDGEIDGTEQSETAQRRSDDSGDDSNPEGTAFTAGSPNPLDGSLSSDSGYSSGDEKDLGVVQTPGPEPDFSSDGSQESAPTENAQEVRQATANIREIAKRRKASLQADSTSASTAASPARSSSAPARTSGIINKPVDVSGVKSVVSQQMNATRRAKSTDAIPKAQRDADKKMLGVASTYNEASVLKSAFEKLGNNTGNLKLSRDIAKTAEKYIASEAQDGKPFLSSPDTKQKKALKDLGLSPNASERDIRVALLKKASASAKSKEGKAVHLKTMITLNNHHQALFNH
ncbi:hypothetical protein, partial [Endozoicomonas sp. ONNA2]|uniref:hypothetical protein n=1 Tax=Endozoicomonas sp. ONNA2 TaxID=2828741 RepID=UPI00214753E8